MPYRTKRVAALGAGLIASSIALTGAMTSGCSPLAQNPAATAEQKEPAMTLKTPTNMLELLENLRDAVRSRMVFDEAFYTEENIKKIAATQDVEIVLYPGTSDRMVQAISFRVDGPKSYETGMSFSIILETNPSGKKTSIAHATISHETPPNLYYPFIEKLVGYAWEVSLPEHFSSHQIYQEPTDPHGNKEREYTRQDGNIVEKGLFKFDRAGFLWSFDLRIEEQ